jgi:hypothetical protein
LADGLSEALPKGGIEVVTPRVLQRYPNSVTYENVSETIPDVLNNVKNSDVVPLIIVTWSTFAEIFLKGLWDAGVRPGDVTIIGTEWLGPSHWNIEDPIIRDQVIQLLQGSIQLSQDAFIGEYGKNILDRLNKAYSVQYDEYMCFYYDAILGSALNFHNMLNSG